MTRRDASPPTIDDGILAEHEAYLLQEIDRIHLELATLRRYERGRVQVRWDEERRHEAEEIGARLGRQPSVTRSRLGQLRHGVLWLIDRWKALGAIATRKGGWDEAQSSLAFDLLGVAPALRDGDPWEAAGLDSPRALVDREVTTLERQLADGLDALDAMERQAAEAGVPLRRSAGEVRLRREEAACWRRLLAIRSRASQGASAAAEAEPEPAPEAAPPVAAAPEPPPSRRPAPAAAPAESPAGGAAAGMAQGPAGSGLGDVPGAPRSAVADPMPAGEGRPRMSGFEGLAGAGGHGATPTTTTTTTSRAGHPATLADVRSRPG